MKKHIYLAGSLFSEAEVNQRLKEGKILNDSLSETHTYFNPIEAPINDKAKLPTSLDIFMGDTLEVLKSDVVIADLANEDAGV
ncbi:MAG: nucleoside 2-deoxyribosyltransferase, partial [Peptostreptococcaceae bacterium]